MTTLADGTNYPLLDVFWTMLWLFVWIIWIFLLIRIINDVFRSPDLSGPAKAAWIIAVIVFPLIAALIYVIARGNRMHQHEAAAAQAHQDALRSYIRSTGGIHTTPADELIKLAQLREQGILDDQEFQAQKARILTSS